VEVFFAADALFAQHVQDVFQLGDHLFDELLVLGGVVLGFVAGEALARPADGETLVIQKRADLADHQHVLALVIPTVAATLHRVELGELLLPIPQHVRFDCTELAHLADREIPFAGYGR